MPKLSNHQSNEFTKMLCMGDSGSGKTGALASLVAAGYKLFILDFDNGLEPLKQFVLRDNPELIDNIEFVTLRDTIKAGAAGPVVTKADAFTRAIKLLDHWKYKDDDGNVVDHGIPADWGPDCILVIDSMTFMGDSAYNFREPLAVRGKDGQFDGRAVYGDAQDAVEGVLALVTGDNFCTNVIVNSHVKYIERQDGTTKGFPTAIGKALSPEIPRYFNSVALFETVGNKRTLKTAPTGLIDLKNPKPFEMLASYPIETGLAAFFAVLREPPAQVEPKSISLKRRA